MQVAKWGNSLAIRLPRSVVDILGLKEGDSIEIHVADRRSPDQVGVADDDPQPGGLDDRPAVQADGPGQAAVPAGERELNRLVGARDRRVRGGSGDVAGHVRRRS